MRSVSNKVYVFAAGNLDICNSCNCKTFLGNHPQPKVRKVEEEAEEAKDFDGEVEAVRRVAFSITKDF